MKDSFYLAIRYLTFFKVRSIVLVLSLGIIIFLPNGLKKLVDESEMQMMRRADNTPLIAGKKGSPTDLVINTLYFQQEKIETLTMDLSEELDQTGFGYSIPVFSTFKARNYPIVGTSLDYFEFRGLELVEGKMIGFVGECVVGSNVAGELSLTPGDSLISSPENFFDLAGVYPLKMNVVGVLNPSDSPDDNAIFVDLKTTWIISGLGHGHEDLLKITDPTIVLQRTDSTVAAGAKLFMYNEINASNLDSFHFHGDPADYPITSVIFVPEDDKSSTLLRGRFEAGELPDQIVVPSQVVENLLQRIFRIKEIFNSMFVVVGIATIMILGLTVALSLRLRKDEMFTMFTIGSSKWKIFEVVTIELMVILGFSLALAGSLYFVTGFYVEEFINRFIL